jgi:3-phosphoshikimate 1-carboxyvinyltransferase
MSFFAIQGVRAIKGTLSLPGDKSIAHRCIILGSLVSAITTIRNFPLNSDCLSTIAVFKRFGVGIRITGNTVVVTGKGLYGLHPSRSSISIAGSGTTFRLMLGVLAGQRFSSTLSAGRQLSRRPMLRVTAPLRAMGARITGCRRGAEEYPPVSIEGCQLTAIRYTMPIASAQVKSAVLFAGLYARGVTVVREKFKSRDHTERMMKQFGVALRCVGRLIRVTGGRELVSPGTVDIPGDISSAAFFIVLASIVKDSTLRITNVNVNATRTGIITVLKRMGGRITIASRTDAGEPSGDIIVKSSELKSTVVKKEEIPLLIDELPILMVAASCARGDTVFKAVGELRVKETDRIRSMVTNLKTMGVPCRVVTSGIQEDIVISGVQELTGARVSSFGDHRTAMSMVVAGAAARGKTVVDGVECINKSFPGFLDTLKKLIA